VVGFAGIFVANVGGEEFDEAARRLWAGGGDERRERRVGRRQEDDFVFGFGRISLTPYSAD
jgi:hypothetical protein